MGADWEDLSAELGEIISSAGDRKSRELASDLGKLISGAVIEQDVVEVRTPSSQLPVIDWNEGQQSAIKRIAAWRADEDAPRIMSLTGAAGTGKTTVMQAVRACLRGSRTAWSAMTGKAASRMKEASGVKAKTLHSVLYRPPREIDNEIEQKIDLDFDSIKDEIDHQSFLLVIDEASMIGPKLRADIERSQYSKILFVGDPYQIPPVLSKVEEKDRGDDYSVFSDVKGTHLSEVMRSSGAVLRAATRVREEQSVPQDSETDASGSSYKFQRAVSSDFAIQLALMDWFEDRNDHVLITWRNETRMLANRVIRKKIGYKSELPEPGEPLVVRRNVHDFDLMNGDLVTAEEWEGPGPTLAGVETSYLRVSAADGRVMSLLVPTQRFDGTIPYVPLDKWKTAIALAGCVDPTPLTYGYCLTGHLAQGSEYRRVTTFLPDDLSNPYFRKQTKLPTGGNMTFSMRFLYTAIARARVHSTLIIS